MIKWKKDNNYQIVTNVILNYFDVSNKRVHK